MKNKKGFTLVELLAVIVILAVILVIAIPQIMNVIKSARMSSIKDSAILIAEQADKDYLTNQVLNKDYNSTSIPCTDVAKLNDDYTSCKITYNNGIATVKLKGSSTGKFANISCKGTKDNMECKSLDGYTDAVEYLTSKVGECGLIKDNHGDLRYQGSNPCNYVTFNDETWRIVGLFDISKEIDGEKTKRIKLVKKDSIGTYSWDSSVSTTNSGYGINAWQSSDVNKLLNEYYYNGISNGTCYNGQNNVSVNCSFEGLKEETIELIDDATWYLGGSISNLNLSSQYANERGNTTCQSESISPSSKCTRDGVTRNTQWIGKIGLVYPSDFGYASENSSCESDLKSSLCGQKNWLNEYGLTISPGYLSGSGVFNIIMGSVYSDGATPACKARQVHPSVYLIPDIQIKGTGTSADPFVFVE